MSDPQTDDEKPLDPAAARIVSRVRWMMAISAFTTFAAVIAVLAVVSYRLLRSDGSASATEVTALLPKGARIVSTAAANDRIVVTIEIAGRTEIRTFDARTLQPAGRLQLSPEP